jgi:hypothetical protein
MTEIVAQWNRYFPGAELPIVFYYTDEPDSAEQAPVPDSHRCFICSLAPVRQGKSRQFGIDAVTCTGGKRYLGFTQTLRPKFEYFLSYGIPGELEGERYRQTPELVAEILKRQKPFHAPGKYIVFKRIDNVRPDDKPLVIIFFATPDVLSGLFTLASYDDPRVDAVITPFGAGCATIVHYPYHEGLADSPRAVLGMLDVSARGCVPHDRLTFAVPWKRFLTMVGNMDESFLITPSWAKVRERIRKHGA